jgi:quercetin dioxygenase-like cupin family protein
MHVSPVDLRTLRQDGILIRFATLGSLAYVQAEIPDGGTAGTSLDRPCAEAHWGFVISGELTFVTERERETITAGRAFHVPAGGPEHRFETGARAVIAGFAPVSTDLDLSDARLAEQGFEIIAARQRAIIVPALAPRPVSSGQIRAESWPMSGLVLTRVRMGERSGYTSGWCDAPHWGLVISGRLAIEWEDDVEILAAGDVFSCPEGPPGHRLEAADPATFIDLTPLAALDASRRLASWRRGVEYNAGSPSSGIAVAALA